MGEFEVPFLNLQLGVSQFALAKFLEKPQRLCIPNSRRPVESNLSPPEEAPPRGGKSENLKAGMETDVLHLAEKGEELTSIWDPLGFP